MDDDKSTAVDEPTEVVDTAPVTDESADNGGDLEDIEVTPEELGDETPDESETEDESEEPEVDEQSETDETEEVQSDEDKQKAFNKQMAERRIQEKQQRELSQKQQQQEYLAQAEDERDLALRQLQVDAYDNKIEGNTNKLTNGYERALNDFDILKNQSPEIQAEVNAALDAFQAMNVTIDAYGNPTDVRGDLYQFLQTKADSISQLTGISVKQQEKNKSKEKSKTLSTPSRAPKPAKVDPDLAAFEEEAGKW